MSPFPPDSASLRHGAIVLAGGRSSRMGRAKWSLPFGDRRLIDRTIDVLWETSPTQIVVVGAAADPPTDLASRDRVTLLTDHTPFPGPLVALRDGMAAFRDSVAIVFVAAVDLPFLSSRFVTEIVDGLQQAPSVDAVVPFLERAHPLCAAYRTRILPLLRTLLETETERRMMNLLTRIETRYLAADEMRSFDRELRSLVNVNDPDDYDDAIRMQEPRS